MFQKTYRLHLQGLLRVIAFHSGVTAESLLNGLSIEGYYLSLTNTVFWDAFMAMSIGALYHVALVRIDVSEIISPPFLG
jgi:hypothetical protein